MLVDFPQSGNRIVERLQRHVFDRTALVVAKWIIEILYQKPENVTAQGSPVTDRAIGRSKKDQRTRRCKMTQRSAAESVTLWSQASAEKADGSCES